MFCGRRQGSSRRCRHGVQPPRSTAEPCGICSLSSWQHPPAIQVNKETLLKNAGILVIYFLQHVFESRDSLINMYHVLSLRQ